ncbi:MAG: hypothetical protein ACTHL8_19065 [Burkholderiaceae bacterium]
MPSTTPAAASPQTLSIWQSGRLVPVAPRARFEPRRAHWIGAGLMVLAAVEMALYVAVLERDVSHAEIAKARAYEQAVAMGRCDVKWGAARTDCMAQASGEPVLAAGDDTPPPNDVYEGAGSSRVSAAMVAGLR